MKNEKYAGNAILQKRYTVDFLTKTTKVNEGEVPQYFVENSHPAVITPETFELVQGEIRRRKAIGKQLSGSGLFTCKIVCGDCGGFYGSKVWDSNNKYRRVVWQCNRKFENEITCRSPHLTEENIKNAFVAAFNRLVADRNKFMADYESKIVELTDNAVFDEQTARLQMECSEASILAQEFISQNARTVQDQEKYKQKYDALVARYDTAKAKSDALKLEKQQRAVSKEKIRRFLDLLSRIEKPLSAFDKQLWQSTVESVTVYTLEDVAVRFRSGTEIRVRIGQP